MTAFADLRLSEPVLEALRDIGYERPSPIQEQAIPPMLEGRDVIGQAQTGSGKTAAFGAPIVNYVDPSDPDTQALVLTPTRELCIQVTQAIRGFGLRKGVEVVATFGGAPIRDQISRLRSGAHVVVGTVGRVLDLIDRGALQLGSCRFVVLDEADEMLDLGFLEDVEKILRRTPNGRQTSLFSATMAPPIRKLADNYLYDPVHVKVKADTLTVDTVEQFRVEVNAKDKPQKLAEVIEAERPSQAIVFCRTKIGTDRLFRLLKDRGNNVRALHGDLSQGQRDGVMLAFKGGRVPLLVATDVAARGLDISTVTHVINYDVPRSPDTYVHRIGRTGRAGASGRAITFVEPKQQREREAIEAHIGMEITPWEAGATTAVGRASRARVAAEAEQSAAAANGNGGGDAAPVVVREKPRRGRKPQLNHAADEPGERIVLVPGAGEGLQVRDVVEAIAEATGLDGEAIREVRVLEHFALATLPAAAVADAVQAIDGHRAGAVTLGAELLRGA
ncbi:Cold-shock DEAD-box protein A [Patulibacter medicamentivorans]|uniref:RNA helicase n=1 Tax=Patulibacter medicamentivorans TaxID=1097667 RepID=H0E9X2_9ACTN|nr:DEAD/DEAH box helicase [Patulibacter medicamentivorans]EHN09520.1 Cold-shock DEAD-box protein A [Patulibacter medicamentivorans]